MNGETHVSEFTLLFLSWLFFLFFSFSRGEIRTVTAGDPKSSRSPIPAQKR